MSAVQAIIVGLITGSITSLLIVRGVVAPGAVDLQIARMEGFAKGLELAGQLGVPTAGLCVGWQGGEPCVGSYCVGCSNEPDPEAYCRRLNEGGRWK